MGLQEPGYDEPPAEPGPELGQRATPRYALMMRAGKLVGATCEFLCILRDVSASGLKVKLFHPLPKLDEFAIELAGGERYVLLPVWEDNGHAGFRFADPQIDLAALLEEINAAGRRRQVRLQVGLPAQITCDGQTFPAHLDNLSQHGARIDCATFLALRQRVRLQGHGMPSRMATVIWRREGSYGLMLEETFRLEELATLNVRLQASRQNSAAAGLVA